jgi:tol-pal system protein YbgF
MRGLLLCCALAGCVETMPRGEIDELKKKLEATERRAADTERKLVEMEDKVFLLTDQIESQKVAREMTARPPRLPVVTLTPPEPAVETDGTVEYRGEAARHSAPIELTNDSKPKQPTLTATRPKTPLQPIAPSGDNLGVTSAPSVARVIREHPSPGTEPGTLYRHALDELKAGKHEGAAEKFREFLKRYPTHDFADNAQYWLGECAYAQHRYTDAARAFAKVISDYPTGNKAPDAMLKLGLCASALGDDKKAAQLYEELVGAYPRSEAARIAGEKLHKGSQ